jgi:hypothetical protein
MGLVEDWRTMTPAELTAVVRQMAHGFRAPDVLSPADEPADEDEVDTVDEDVAALDLKPRQRIIIASVGFPKFRLVKQRAVIGHQVLLLQVKPAPVRDWRTLAAVRVSKRPRVIDEDAP